MLLGFCARTAVAQAKDRPNRRPGPPGQARVVALYGPDDALGRILERGHLGQAEEKIRDDPMRIVAGLGLLGHDHGSATSTLPQRELFAESALATAAHPDDADRGHTGGQPPLVLVLEAR